MSSIELGVDERQWVREALSDCFAVDDITTGALSGRAIRVRGRFLIDTGRSFLAGKAVGHRPRKPAKRRKKPT